MLCPQKLPRTHRIVSAGRHIDVSQTEHADGSSVARDLTFDLSLLLTYFVRARKETSGKTEPMHWLMSPI